MPVLSTDTARLNGMPKPSAATTPFHLVYGGDSYLNDQTVRDLKHEAQRRYPDAETIELDAANADHYAFDEAVSPSVLAFLQNAAHNKQCASANVVCTRTKKYYIILNRMMHEQALTRLIRVHS